MKTKQIHTQILPILPDSPNLPILQFFTLLKINSIL